jgi:hypothetical protein
MPVHDCSTGNKVFANTSVWVKSTGTLTVLLEQDTVANTEYCLRFTVKNKAATQGTPAVPTATISGVPLTDNANGYGHTHANVTTDLIDANPIWHEFVCPQINTSDPALPTYWSDSERYKIGHIPVPLQ